MLSRVAEQTGASVEDDLRQALVHRTDIGIAMGVLMERFDVDRDAAFVILRRASQDENRKLHQIAAEVAATRKLPPSLLDGNGSKPS